MNPNIQTQFDKIWGTKTPTQGMPNQTRADEIMALAKQNTQEAEKPSVGGFIGNVAKSGLNLAKGIGSAVINTVNPDMSKNTLVNLGKTAVGAVETLIPGRQGAEQYAEALKNYAVDRYGSWDKIKQTAYEDPVGFALDLSTVLGGVGGAVSKIGKIGGVAEEVSNVSKVGNIISKAGEITNPIFPAAKLGGAIAKGAGSVLSKGRDVSLGIATGKGAETMNQAFKAGEVGGEAGKAFRTAMGGTLPEEVVGQAQDALGVLYGKRSSAYESGIKTIQEQTAKTTLSKEGIIGAGNKALEDLGVINKKTGALDFSSRPSLDAKAIKKAADVVNDWKDTSPLGLNQLRQELDGLKKGGLNLNSADSKYNFFIDGMKNNLKSYVEKEVPGIKDLNVNYAKSSDFIKEIRTDLLTKDPSRTGVALQKLQSALRTDNKFKIELMDEVKAQTGIDLAKTIAGSNLNTYIPGGLIGRSADAFALLKGFKALVDPSTLIRIAATSPKLVGNFLYGLGATKRFATNFLNLLKKIPKKDMDIFLKTGFYGEEIKKEVNP